MVEATKESDEIDVLVVGAGPAGSAAATVLARAGYDVLLCDRHAFPRDKPCGDLIGARALSFARQLGIDEAALAPYPPLTGALLLGDGHSVDLSPGGRLGRSLLRSSDARIIPRRVFDAALVERAVASGARLCRANVRRVGSFDAQQGGRLVEAQGDDGPVRYLAHSVVVAGGYGCRVAPDILPDPAKETSGPPTGIAMRGYVSGVDGLESRIAFCLDDWMLPGYGWVFPLPDGGANVGVGTLTTTAKATGEPLRALYDRFVADTSSPVASYLRDTIAVDGPRSWPLDLGPRRRRLAAPGLVVAGEAAGLVGPLTGAGIAFALESGMNAGAAVAASLRATSGETPAIHTYARETSRRTLPWLRAELLAQRWLSDPRRTRNVLAALATVPGLRPLGARVLLHLG